MFKKDAAFLAVLKNINGLSTNNIFIFGHLTVSLQKIYFKKSL